MSPAQESLPARSGSRLESGRRQDSLKRAGSPKLTAICFERGEHPDQYFVLSDEQFPFQDESGKRFRSTLLVRHRHYSVSPNGGAEASAGVSSAGRRRFKRLNDR